jgi:stage III sporulation protein AE
MGLSSSLFSGLLSLQQMVAAAGDSLGSRVVKFSLSSFVPVVGGVLSDAYNTVVGCGGLLRSTVGAFGVLSVVLVVLPPLLSCVCWNVGLQLAGGTAALFGLAPLDTLCRTAAGAVKVLIAVLAVFALLMILSTSVVVFVGR